MAPNDKESLTEEALAAARREGARVERRRLLIALVACATLLVTTLAAGWALVVQARDAAPVVISEMATERRVALEKRLKKRANEAAALTADLFGFLEQVWLESDSLHQIRAGVRDAQAELRLLDKEVRAAIDAPMTSMGPLLENGPTRARQLAEHLVEVTAEIQRLVPTVIGALDDARQTFEESPEGSAIPAAIASMDTLLEPFVGQDEALRTRWKELKAELLSWVERAEADLAQARQQWSGETLADEFLERMQRRLF